jgi:hypothetical protein
MQREYPVLFNFVHADNHVSIKWLSWLGFVIQGAQPAGPEGAPFRFFYRRLRV